MPLTLVRARRLAGLVTRRAVALLPVPVTALAAVGLRLTSVGLRLTAVGLLLVVIRGAAASGAAVLAVPAVLLLPILTVSAVPVAVVLVGSVTVVLSALVAVGLPVIGLVRPLWTRSATGHPS